MKKAMLSFLSIILLLLSFSCSELGERDNIFDSGGDNWEPPVLVTQADTVVSQTAAVEISLAVEDYSDSIITYYWDIDSDGFWDTTSVTMTFIKPEGGEQIVIWGAENEDGVISKDTFVIRFNHIPSFTVILPDSIISGEQIHWDASDIDELDTLTYMLKTGLTKDNLTPMYSGQSASTSLILKYAQTYHWELTVQDPYGDSAVASGVFHTPFPPEGMAFIPAKDSSFLMGGTTIETLSANFYMDTTEVTQWLYTITMRDSLFGYTDYSSPYWDCGGDSRNPAYKVSWYDAALFCNARSKIEGRDTVYSYSGIHGIPGKGCYVYDLKIDISKNGYRLPSEIEWEYACRAGTNTMYYWGNSYDTAYCQPFRSSPTYKVAEKLPNSFGLYDMSGNVMEWCNDLVKNQNVFEGIVRGGSSIGPNHPESLVQSSSRSRFGAYSENYMIGFRTVVPE